MAYGVKYRIEYNRRSGSLRTIDILENSYAGVISFLKPDSMPLQINFSGDVDNIYSPTVGSGATITCLATPLVLMDFMTDDPQKFKVIVYDGASGSTIDWQGFICTNIYGENYSYANSMLIPIIIQCTDGMSLLDNIKYTQTNLTPYIGSQTIGGIIQEITEKLNLVFDYVYTTETLEVDSETNIYDTLAIWNENFTDESDQPMSCRQVLDSIIGGVGMSLYFWGTAIYIYDPINLHDDSVGIRYGINFDAGTPVLLGGYKDISTLELKWGETDSQLDVVRSFSEAIVKYDPYNYYEESYNFSDSANWTDPGTFVSESTYFLNDSVRYTMDPPAYMSIASKYDNYSQPDYMLMFNNGGESVEYTFPKSIIQGDVRLGVRISIQVFVQTKRADADIYNPGTTKVINRVIIPFAMEIGGYWWEGFTNWNDEDTNKWNEFWVYGSDHSIDYMTETINDKWVNASIVVPLEPNNQLVSGNIKIELLDEFTTTFPDQILPADEDYFTDSITKTSSIIDDGVSFAYSTEYSIRVTIVGFKDHIGLDPGVILLYNSITSITSPSGQVAIDGIYEDVLSGQHNYSETDPQLLLVSYTPSTDTLVYDVFADTPFFNGDFDSFVTGVLTDITYNFGYRSTILFIKDIKLDVIDMTTGANIGNPGVEKRGVLSTNLNGKTVFEVNTTSGTGSNGASRGAFKSNLNDGENITGLNRVGEGTSYDTADLILQNIISQYKYPRFKITGVFDISGQPFNLRTFLIKDSNWLGSKAFYIVNGIYQDQDELLSMEMIEITETREAIE